MPRPAIHHPSPDIDFILFPYEQLGCIIYDDPIAGLKAEDLCEGADEVVRYWMRKLRTRRIALLSSPTPRDGWTTFEHQGTAENGWQIYIGDLDGHAQTMKLCPNFALYYPETPKPLDCCSPLQLSPSQPAGAPTRQSRLFLPLALLNQAAHPPSPNP